MRRIAVVRVLLGVVSLGAGVTACTGGEDDDDDGATSPTPVNTAAPAPPVGGPIADLELFDGWTNPRWLPDGVNTIGWEDSSFISPDGQTLYFGYSRGNITMLVNSGMQVADGPMRPGHHFDGFDIYEARIESGAWVVTNSSVNDAGDWSEAAQGVDAGPNRMAFIRFELNPGYDPNIYFADWNGSAWTNVQKAPAPLNTDCEEDNTSLSADGTRLYWDSNRADATGTSCLTTNGILDRAIWMSEWDAGTSTWGTPVKVAGQDWVSPVIHWQPYEDFAGENLYWSGADAVTCQNGCLYKAPITAPGTVGTVERVMRITTGGNGHAYAIGEMSITADGEYLYFTFGVRNSAGTIDISLGVAER